MVRSDAVFAGIDCTSGSGAFTYAVLDQGLRPLSVTESDLEGISEFLSTGAVSHVAVNAPSHLNTGIVRKEMEGHASHAIRGAELRVVEHELHTRGISISATPHSEAMCPAWVQAGFLLYRNLHKLGYRPFPQDDDLPQWLETHPHAGFCVLIGAAPLAKPTLEGRLQRALVLFESGVRLRDPMNFLEEITRHRLLHGALPLELVPPPEQLDALLAAFTAWKAANQPDQVTRLGNKQEGFITLPGPELKDRY